MTCYVQDGHIPRSWRPERGKWRARLGGLLVLVAALVVATTRAHERAVELVESEQRLERDIAVLKAEIAARHTAVHHPHPRIRKGVFGKTMRELSGAIEALAGVSGHSNHVDAVKKV
jgi:hypothetical protein